MFQTCLEKELWTLTRISLCLKASTYDQDTYKVATHSRPLQTHRRMSLFADTLALSAHDAFDEHDKPFVAHDADQEHDDVLNDERAIRESRSPRPSPQDVLCGQTVNCWLDSTDTRCVRSARPCKHHKRPSTSSCTVDSVSLARAGRRVARCPRRPRRSDAWLWKQCVH